MFFYEIREILNALDNTTLPNHQPSSCKETKTALLFSVFLIDLIRYFLV